MNSRRRVNSAVRWTKGRRFRAFTCPIRPEPMKKPDHADIVELVERREKVGRLLLDLRQFADKLFKHAHHYAR